MIFFRRRVLGDPVHTDVILQKRPRMGFVVQCADGHPSGGLLWADDAHGQARHLAGAGRLHPDRAAGNTDARGAVKP